MADPNSNELDEILENLAVKISDNQSRLNTSKIGYTDARLKDDGAIAEAKESLSALITKRVTEAQENRIYNFPRAMGKTAYFTEQFIKHCKEGETAEYHHPDYVVMSRAQYDKIQKKLAALQSKQLDPKDK